MSAASIPYIRRPRPTLWLLRGGELACEEVRAIYISKSPVTNDEYEAYMPEHERGPTSAGDDQPAVNVSFAEATEYCRRYGEASGKPFRLPTELEWEYACRAEVDQRYFWGDRPEDGDAYCWDQTTSDGRCRSIEVGKPNDYGLYDMLGNVWEWTSSPYEACSRAAGHAGHEASLSSRIDDLQGARVLRGGSFRTPRVDIGCAARLPGEPTERRDDIGFRIVRFL